MVCKGQAGIGHDVEGFSTREGTRATDTRKTFLAESGLKTGQRVLMIMIIMDGSCIAQIFLSRKLNALAHTLHANVHTDIT